MNMVAARVKAMKSALMTMVFVFDVLLGVNVESICLPLSIFLTTIILGMRFFINTSRNEIDSEVGSMTL